mmetsp:Transcript_31513/g.91145  ORF Transcript_31513/g.91145 Transcript_31513/m.91145 type:complete len:225 (+) Transcript_31513:76-750(+)
MPPRPKAAAYGRLSEDPSQASGLRTRPKAAAVDSDSEEEDNSKLSDRELAKKKWVQRLNWVWRKCEAAFWVGVSCLMIWWTNFFRVIWEHPSVNRTYFYLALACLFFNIALLGYLTLWCHCVKGIKDPWETHNPKAIPVMAVMGVCTTLFFFFAFWRVWGFLTLVIEIVLFFGFVNSAHFLPSGNLGAVFMFVIFFGAWFTSEMIPHEGLAHYAPRASTTPRPF